MLLLTYSGILEIISIYLSLWNLAPICGGKKKNPLSFLTSLGETKLPLPTSQLKLQKDLICKGV